MTNNIKDILEKRNKSLYRLFVNAGISYPTIQKLSNNKTIVIRFDYIETIYKVLELTLDHLFKIE